MLKEKIKEDLKKAMREHNDIAKNTLKGALAAFTNELISLKRTPRNILSDEEELAVLKKMEKQRKDAILKFTEGNREDLVKLEEAEIEILKKYLPSMMTIEEITKIGILKKKELGITDISKMGILIGAILKETSGKADGLMVKEVVLSLLD